MKKKELFVSLAIIIVLTLIPIFIFRDFDNANTYLNIASYTMLMFMCSFMVQYFVERNAEKKENKEKEEKILLESHKVDRHLKFNLDDKDVWLVDYENCPYIPNDLKNRTKDTICYIFANENQHERVRKQINLFDTKAFIEVIYSSKVGKNLVDMELSSYVGMITALYTPKEITVYSKDRGYGVLKEAMNNIGINNINLIRPDEEEILTKEECENIYIRIKANTKERDVSLGEFKKKIRKNSLNISADEINYLINYLIKNNRVEKIKNGTSERIQMK